MKIPNLAKASVIRVLIKLKHTNLVSSTPSGLLLSSRGGGTPRFLTGDTNVLIWGLQFGVGEITWGLKFRGPRCAICSLKFGVGEII